MGDNTDLSNDDNQYKVTLGYLRIKSVFNLN